MPLIFEIIGFALLILNGFWFIATSMTDVVGEDGVRNKGMTMVRKWLLITFAVTSMWIGIVMWMVVF